MSICRAKTAWLALIAVALCAQRVTAQCPDSAPVFVVLGTAAEDRLRLAELRGCVPTTLLRSPLALGRVDSASASLRISLIYPVVLATRNSKLPYSINDGARWAGRGWSSTTTMGARLQWRNVTANFAPEFVTVANDAFPIIVAPDSVNRSGFINPFHFHGRSIDAPLRFGYDGYTLVALGQSAIEARFGPVALGASTENLWWGAGIRSGLVMSNNAAGIPQAYVRTPKPVVTRWGNFEGRLLLGVLTESRFFDLSSENDYRSFSGVAATWSPKFEPGLTIGASRVMLEQLPDRGALAADVHNFALTLYNIRMDEMSSLFGRWGFPENDFELHWEWARLRLPSLRGLLVNPQANQGYTIGAQWAPRLDWLSDLRRDSVRVRLQGEATMLEQTASQPGVETPGYYTSFRVPQGYTQRGEVIGAATGTGSSNQWLMAELIDPRASFGLFIGRIRWEEDAYFLTQPGLKRFTHDVSLLKGMRGSLSLKGLTLNAEFMKAKRLNTFFQTPIFGDYWNARFDVYNYTLNLGASYSR